MTYKEKLLDPRWQKKRLTVLDRDDWSCQLCGTKLITLHVHHKKYSKEPWDASDDDLISYCKDCHWIEEYVKKNYKCYTVYHVARCVDRMFAVIGELGKDECTNKVLFFSGGGDDELSLITEIEPFEVAWMAATYGLTNIKKRND